MFELLSCICLSGHETESRGAIWRSVEEKMRGEPEGERKKEIWEEPGRGGPMMNGWRTGMRDGAA